MAKVLLIKREDLIKFTQANGNIDSDKLMQHVAIAQDMHLQSYLGTDLLAKLQADIQADSLAGDYLDLVTDWIKPVLIHWTAVELIPYLAITMGNGGIYRHEPESGTPLDSEEIRSLTDLERKRAVYYTDRLIDFLSHNNEKFPEYTSNTEEDVHPNKNSNYCTWNL